MSCVRVTFFSCLDKLWITSKWKKSVGGWTVEVLGAPKTLRKFRESMSVQLNGRNVA